MSAYSMVPTGAPNSMWGGGALGGIAQMGLSAFKGFQNGQQYLDWWRNVQNQRMLDQFAVPAKAAEHQANFQQDALSAQLGQQQFQALAAMLKQKVNPQGALPMDRQQAPIEGPPASAAGKPAQQWAPLDPNANQTEAEMQRLRRSFGIGY